MAVYKSEAEFLELLQRALRQREFRIELAPSREHTTDRDTGPDFVVSRAGQSFVVEFKTAGLNRSEVLHGLMAAALLRGRRLALTLQGANALPIVGLSNLSDRATKLVAEFMAREAPDAAWGLLDRDGDLYLHGVAGFSQEPVVRRARAPRLPSKHELDLFTDLGQWMAKVLVARRLPDELLAAPRTKFQRARHLAAVAGVSEPTAARWVKQLRERGFVRESAGQLELVRVQEFFELWQRAVSSVPRRETPARFSLPAGASEAQLQFALAKYASERVAKFHPRRPPEYGGAVRWKSGPRACLGLFGAAVALGHPHVLGAPVHLYLESVTDDSLRSFELERTTAERATLRVIEPAFPESLFRAIVLAPSRDGSRVPTCDIVQTWLDVRDHPVRGREQAGEIERDVLAKWVFPDVAP